MEPVDYNPDVDGPIITVKLSGEYTYTEGLKVMGPKPLSPTTSYRFKQEEGDWKIYRSKSEDSSKWIDKINYR